MRTRQKSVESNENSRGNALAVRGTVLIRADASVAVGTGHVMRCLALAQEWQDKGGSAVFAMSQFTPAVRERLQREGVGVVQVTAELGSADDARETVAIARQNHALWVVVDGYGFGAEYQEALKVAGLKVLFIDDNGHAAHYSADLVLNQNAHANEALYRSRELSTKLLLGPRFAMLRREFAARRGWKREIAAIGRSVLVTMGGSDPGNLTALVMEAVGLVEIEGLEARIVVGGSNPHFESLQLYAVQNAERMTVWRSVSNMAELMAWADIAVSSAGTTSWELAFMSLPSVLLTVVEHQFPVARALGASRAGVNLGWFSEIDKRSIASAISELLADGRLRNEMAANGRGLVDGYGADRVVSVLAEGQGCK
jgi:UDP-2,4-diacetamido-2,4,6-trideoxy-beta-L-altropyranose hydrolase